MNPTTTTEERYYPVGRWCSVSIAGEEKARRFVYCADVNRLCLDLRRSYPNAGLGTSAMSAGTEGAARYVITLHGPEHPALLLRLAEAMALPEVRA